MTGRLRPRSYELTPIAEMGDRFADFAPYVVAIDEFALTPVSTNRVCQVAIRVTLASGRQVVVRADPGGDLRP